MKQVLSGAMMLAVIMGSLSAPALAMPTAEQRHRLDQKLQAMGLPPGLESWVDDPAEIHQVTLAPLFEKPYACTEHPLGQLHGAGDALGTDCMVVGGFESDHGFAKMYRGDGTKNTDWYGWHTPVHAPIDGVVKYIHLNTETNTPGTMGKPPASMMVFERADGVTVVYAHLTEPVVKVEDHVTAGQVVAIDGNNGVARNPHIHVGAYRGGEPLQIRWDLRAMGKVPGMTDN